MALALPRKFLLEAQKDSDKTFGLLTINSRGVEDEATTEADWAANTSESNVDFDGATNPPPDSGDVILAATASENTTSPVYPGSDLVNEFDSGNWDSVNTPESDANEIFSTNQEDVFLGVPEVITDIPDNAKIKNIIITVRAKETIGQSSVEIGYKYSGTEYYDSAQGITASFANYIYTVATNPDTSKAWTPSEVKSIQGIGVTHPSVSVGYLHVSVIKMMVTYYDFEASGNITVEFDLTGANTNNKGIVSIDDNVPTGAGLTYTLEGSTNGDWLGEEVALGAVIDGSEVEGYDYYRPTANFTSNGIVTSVLKSIGIEIPDNVYKFSSLGDDTFGARPIITSLPGRTIQLDTKSFITLPSDLNVGLERLDFVDNILRQNYFRGLEANVKIGLWRDDLTEDDLVPYYRGTVATYSVTESEIILKLRDATKDMSRKWPLGTPPSTSPVQVFDGTHMVDCIKTILDDISISDRFINQGSLDVLKSTVGQDGSIPLTSSNWVVKRTGTDPDTGGTAILDAEAARGYIGQLLGLMGAYLVTQENGKLTAILYDADTTIVDTWTPDFYDATKYDAALEGLRNVMSLYSDWDGDGDKANDFVSLFITKDSGSITNWGEELERILKSEWIAGDSSDGYFGNEIAEFITGRETARQADGIGSLPCQTSLVKAGVQVGDFIDMETDLAIKPDIGKGDTVKFFVTKKTWDIENGKINWTLLEAR